GRGGGSAASHRRPTRHASIRRGEFQVGDGASHRRTVGGGSRYAGRERRNVMEVGVPLVSSTDRGEGREGLSPQVLDERTSFLGGSALMLWAQIASASGLFVAVLVLARGLGPEGRGTMAFISVAALVIGRVARIGAGEAMAILAAQRRSERSALLGALAVFVVPVTVVFTVASAAFTWAIAMSIGGLIGFTVAMRTAGLARPDLRLLAQLIKLGSRLWIGTLTSFLNLRVDQLLMGFISTKAILGIYAVAVDGAEVLLYVPTAIGEALYPFLAVGDPRERAQQALRAAQIG